MPLSSYERFDPPDRLIGYYEVAGKQAFVTTVPHRYDGPIVSVVVPAGSVTDFASVPWPLTVIFPRVGPYARAALLHDELYIKQTVSRRVADALFLHWMEVDGTPWLTRYAMYAGVRLGGWYFWNKRARNKQ